MNHRELQVINIARTLWDELTSISILSVRAAIDFCSCESSQVVEVEAVTSTAIVHSAIMIENILAIIEFFVGSIDWM